MLVCTARDDRGGQLHGVPHQEHLCIQSAALIWNALSAGPARTQTLPSYGITHK